MSAGQAGVGQGSMLEAALEYAENGIAVFPLAPNTKIPLKDSRGVYDATNDLEQIKAWWTQFPNANIGMRMGLDLGLFALDIDNEKMVSQLEADYGELPNTPFQITPKGRHYIFQNPSFEIKNATKFLDDCDTRAEGGYIVVSPSIVNGRRYQWSEGIRPWETKVAKCPDWLEEILPRKNEVNLSDSNIYNSNGSQKSGKFFQPEGGRDNKLTERQTPRA